MMPEWVPCAPRDCRKWIRKRTSRRKRGLGKPHRSRAKTEFFLMPRAFACGSGKFSVPNWDRKVFARKNFEYQKAGNGGCSLQIAWWKLRWSMWLNTRWLVILLVHNGLGSVGEVPLSDGRVKEAKTYSCLFFFFFWSISCLNKTFWKWQFIDRIRNKAPKKLKLLFLFGAFSL